MAMNGTITTWFKDKGFGFIKDENGENRYFHVIKVANPDLIKKDAAVTFEPTTNNKGLSAYAVKVIPESKYIYIAGERLKLTSIKSYVVYREEEPVETRVDKENAVLSGRAADEQHPAKSHGAAGRDALGEKAGDYHLSGDNPDLFGRRNRYRCHGKTA
ncbi:cold-shock protein [Klebsiella pneumoniae]|nr:cold-shock protein [Klebsiella pneumoniae]